MTTARLNQKLKILHLEDLPADARLTEIEIRQAGLQFDLLLVTNKKDFAKGLAEFKADIVLSGHSLPDINSKEALRLTKLQVPEIPFVLVTSMASEEHAVEIMREGAYDYVRKDRLKRLPKVIENAIEQWSHENERSRCMEQIVTNEARYRQIIETAQEGIWMLDTEFKTTFVNQRLCEILEYSLPAEMIGRVLSDFMDGNGKEISNTALKKNHGVGESIEVTFLTKNGKKIWACLSLSPSMDQNKNFNGMLVMFTNITNKKLTEEKLRQRNNLLRTLIDNVPDYIFVKDLQSRHLINNKANIDLLGFQNEEETLGKSMADLIPGMESEEFIKDDLQILKSGIPIINKEETITTRTGEKHWVLTTKIPLKDETGVITGLVGICRNITERKQISEKLAATALKDISDRLLAMEEIEKLSFVARKTDNSVMITDAEQKIEWINESFTRMTGYTLEEVKGLKSGFLRGEETDVAMVEWMNSRIYHAESFSGELINYSKTGRKYWLKLEISPVFNDDGKLKNFISIQSDITAQKEFESKITAIARELSSLIENANVPIFGVDRNGHINEWNKVSSELSEFSKSELFGKRWSEAFVGSENRAAADQMIANVLQGNPVSNFELAVFTKSKKRLILLLSASPRRDSEKVINGAILVAQDITELIEYRANLEKMVQDRTRELNEALQKEKDLVNMKSKFVSIASHEFRTPLSTISLAAGFLKKFKKEITPEEVDNKLSNIEKQVSHMTRLLDDVLVIGKAEAGKIPVRLVPINVLEFFERLCGEIEQSTAKTHKIRLIHHLQIPTIHSDEKLLRNIVINSLINAIKFSPKADHVDFTVRSDADKLSFQIRDYGIGIPTEDMKQLFEPFHRGSNVNAIQGTGLGLSIIKKGVDLLHGFIDVKSKVGTGTELNVILPAMHE
jgi:PAS domain S-box-containing protein